MRTRFFTRRTWATPLYALASLPLAVSGAAATVVLLALGVILVVTPLGLWVTAAAVRTARWFATVQQRLARDLLHDETPIAEFKAASGILGWRRSVLGDRYGWLSVAYLLVKIPIAALDAVLCLVMWLYGFLWLFWPLLRNWDDVYSRDSHGVLHRGIGYGDFRIDTLPKTFLVTAAGVLLLLVASWAMQNMVVLDRTLIKSVLGTDLLQVRVDDLERSRAFLVDDSAARLRRIERDLHDGAQARLVALGMNLVMVKESLRSGADLEQVYRLIDTAQENAKTATSELRDLVRGIHPPVLDQGLETALGTLASSSAIQTAVTTEIGERPSAAIETMAYFCASELLTNAAKHSGAKRATVDVRTTADGRVVLSVTDEGRGSATVTKDGGLAGLADRVGTVDGTLTVVSPPGGPTVVTVDLPTRI